MGGSRAASARPGSCCQGRSWPGGTSSPQAMGSASLQANQSSTAAPQLPGRQLFSSSPLITTSFGFPSPGCTFQIIDGLLQLGYRALSELSTGLRLQTGVSQSVQRLLVRRTDPPDPPRHHRSHLFEFISQDLDLLFVFILFLGVLRGRKGISDLQPSAASCISHSKVYSYKGTLQLPTAVHMPTNFQTLSPYPPPRGLGQTASPTPCTLRTNSGTEKLSSQQH